jgi:type II secretory pathway pseudopilin PulG
MSSFCTACGNSITAEDKFCRVCGRPVSANVAESTSGTPVVAAAGSAETSGKAITSLVCGLLFFVPLAFIGAIVFGHLGLSEIRKSAGRLKGEGMAIAGLVLGYLWIVGLPLILIIAAIAIPNLLRARMAANESSAIASIRTINAAEVRYAQAHSNAGFTCSLSDLAGDQLISSDLAGGSKHGYAFELSDCSPGAEGTGNVKYRVVAYPVTVNTTGVRAFCSDESAVIRVDSGGSARGCLENGSPLP